MGSTSTRRRASLAAIVTAGSALALVLAGCAGGSSGDSATGTLKVWAQEGQAGEVQTAKDEVAAFNKSQSKIVAKLTLVPQATYGQTISSTKVANLPDVYEYDGETLAALVYAGKLREIGDVVSKSTISDELASVKSETKYSDGKYYGVAQYDSGLGLFGNKSMLAAAGITDLPTTDDKAWTVSQFNDVLSKLAAANPKGKAIDLKEQYAGTWPGYAFTPVVASAGEPLVENGKADGHLNAPKVTKALEYFAKWRAWTDPNADDKAFTDKRVALAWVGHWTYPDNSKALGDDLVVMPLPNFGNGTKSGQGSHAWGINPKTTKSAAAGKFLDFIMQKKWVDQITKLNGAVPGTNAGIAGNSLYASGGPLELYVQQLAKTCGSKPPTKDCVTVPRTISPGWPVINKAFSDAFFAIYNGSDAQDQLDKAAKIIDQDYKDNDGYK